MKRPPTWESLIDVTPPLPYLPHKPRGHSSAFSSVDAGAYKAPHIRAFSLSGQEHHHRLFPPYCPSHHATSLTWCVLSSPSQSQRGNNSCWCTACCSTSHVPDAPAPVVRLLQGAGSGADYYVANWGSKISQTCLLSSAHLYKELIGRLLRGKLGIQRSHVGACSQRTCIKSRQ